MSVRRVALILAAAPLALAVVPGAQGGRTCGGGATLASSRDARVYIVNDVDAFVCSQRTGRRHRLASFNGYGEGCVHVCESLAPVRVTSRYAAWTYHYDFSYGGDVPDEHRSSVQVFRVRTGRQVRGYDTLSPQLLLDPHGETVTVEPAPTGSVLAARPVSGGRRVLDTGTISDVKLTGEVVSWSNGGAPKQAALR